MQLPVSSPDVFLEYIGSVGITRYVRSPKQTRVSDFVTAVRHELEWQGEVSSVSTRELTQDISQANVIA